MTYGNTSELWFVVERGKELKYNPSAMFQTLAAAKKYATENISRANDFAIYEAKLLGFIVLDSPRWAPESSDNG